MIFRFDLKIFIFFILFYFTKQLKIYLIIMIFTIIHETSHLIVGKLLKMKVEKITLMPYGLSAQIYSTNGDYRKIEKNNLIVAIAGPMANILIMIITRFLKINLDIKQVIIYSNFLIAIFNLIPIYPLDGGRILRAILKLKFNDLNVDVYINKTSNIVLFFITFIFSILIYYVKNVSILFILLYLWYIVLKENKIYKTKQKIYSTIYLEKFVKKHIQ